VTTTLTRSELLSRGARGSALVAVAGSSLGLLAGTADAAAQSLPSSDLAYVRLLVGAELLAGDFYGQAIAAANSTRGVAGYLKRAAFNEQEHYASVAGILSGAGATPAVATDFTFSYPTGTFSGERSILAFAQKLEQIMLGSYLGAIAGVQSQSLLPALATIAACEAQHSSYFGFVQGGKAFDLSFPPPLTISEASDAMAPYAQ